MLVGVAAGYFFIWIGQEKFVNDWIKPWGNIFIKLLKLIAIPLVFISLVKGISQMKEFSKLSKLGLRTIIIYLITTTVAVTIGIGMASTIRPGKIFPQDKAVEYKEKFAEKLESGIEKAEKMKDTGPLHFIEELVPENIIAAGSDNSAMLQIIFTAILAGLAVIAIGEKNSAPLIPVIDSINLVILKIIDFIMNMAPIGVFALMAGMISDFAGDGEMFASLGLYALTVILTLFIIAFLIYPLCLRLLTGTPAGKFIKGVFPVQLVAFSTSSSAATLPFTMEHSQEKLGISEEVASFVLPVGTTINMDGTSAYQSIAILFIAQIFGIDLSMSQMMSVVLLTILASIGTPGVPGASVVMTVMVLTSIGIPVEGLVLILGIDRPLDMLRTVVNVTGDIFVAKLIQKGLIKNSEK